MTDIVRDPYGNPLNRDKLITALRAENERLRTYALKAFTVIEAEFWQQNSDLGKALLENEKLRAVLELYREAVRIDATMEGPKFMGSNTSALKRAWDADLAALGGKDE